MLNINFVPDDYIQSNESKRTNMIYLVLFSICMAALFGTFLTIKVRQRNLDEREKSMDKQLAQKKEQITQVEKLQQKRNEMWNTALTTVELIEPVAKSLILAALTNNLPEGTSMLKIGVIQKEPSVDPRKGKTAPNSYQAKQAAVNPSSAVSAERLLENIIDIEGLAPSDLEVAFYIERLSNCPLFTNVALVESREFVAGNAKQPSASKVFRHFKLTAMLQKDVQLTDEDISRLAMAGSLTSQSSDVSR